MVAGSDDFKQVTVGPSGLLSAPGASPRIIVDGTTVSLEASAQVRSQLAERDVALLAAAAGSAYARGVRHVYVGNVGDRFAALQHTRCAACHAVLITRQGYRALDVRLVDGSCSDCGTTVGGLWTAPRASDRVVPSAS
jgi:hypothetical protein